MRTLPLVAFMALSGCATAGNPVRDSATAHLEACSYNPRHEIDAYRRFWCEAAVRSECRAAGLEDECWEAAR